MDLPFLRSVALAAGLHLLIGAAAISFVRVTGVDVQAIVHGSLPPLAVFDVELLEQSAQSEPSGEPEQPAAGQHSGQTLPAEPLAKAAPAPATKFQPAPPSAAESEGAGEVGGATGPLAGVGSGDGPAEQSVAQQGGGTGGPGAPRARGPGAIGLNRDMTWMWVDPKAVGGNHPPAPASTSGGLHEALDAHDRKLGLGFGGPVVSVVHTASLGTRAPVTGDAVLEASFDASGRVLAVNVLSVGGNMAGWQHLAQVVRRMLSSRKLRVPPAGNGVAVTVQVVARYQLPSGSAAGDALQLRGAGAQFDLSDIGAVSARSVSVRILSERRL